MYIPIYMLSVQLDTDITTTAIPLTQLHALISAAEYRLDGTELIGKLQTFQGLKCANVWCT